MKASTFTRGALHRPCWVLPRAAMCPGWQRASDPGEGRPKQPRAPGHLPLELGHRTQDTFDRPGSHSMEWPRRVTEGWRRGWGPRARLWGSRQVTLSLCTLE